MYKIKCVIFIILFSFKSRYQILSDIVYFYSIILKNATLISIDKLLSIIKFISLRTVTIISQVISNFKKNIVWCYSFIEVINLLLILTLFLLYYHRKTLNRYFYFIKNSHRSICILNVIFIIFFYTTYLFYNGNRRLNKLCFLYIFGSKWSFRLL